MYTVRLRIEIYWERAHFPEHHDAAIATCLQKPLGKVERTWGEDKALPWLSLWIYLSINRVWIDLSWDVFWVGCVRVLSSLGYLWVNERQSTRADHLAHEKLITWYIYHSIDFHSRPMHRMSHRKKYIYSISFTHNFKVDSVIQVASEINATNISEWL